jgi:hypothetical protein
MTEEATIRRGVRNSRHTVLPNHVLEDSRLSMETRWLVSYLLSKPDNWIVRIGDITKRGGCGRDKARRMVNEMVEFGYAQKEQARGDGGKFGKLMLVVFDEPIDRREGDSEAEKEGVSFVPQTEKPSTGEPSTVKPTLVNTESLARTDSQNGRAQAQARERGADLDRNAEKQFWRIVKTWPGFDGMPKEAAKPHFLALDQASRDAAERKQPGWLALLKAQGKDHVPAPSTYFRERLFDVVDDPLDGPKPPVEARPFGKLWGALRMRRLLTERPHAAPAPPRVQADLLAEDSERGRQARLDRQAAHGWPQVNFMHEQAANRKGVTAPAAEEGLGELCEAVHVGSDLRTAWKDAHRARGWPWPSEFDRVEWVYFPAGGPDGLAEFERAVRGKDDDGDRRQAAE